MQFTKTKIHRSKLKSKFDRIMEGLGVWTSFYRCNPHRFAKDYLGMHWMTQVQEILVVLMFHFNYIMVIASRGMGKTQIVAAVLVLKCILYPGIEICIASGKRGQSINVIKKILGQFLHESNNLRSEIEAFSDAPSNAYIIFKNGSKINVTTAAESARSNRAHILVCDEFVMIKENTLNTVLRKFKAGQRTPGFFSKPEYKNYPKEPNGEIYISSASIKQHYAWTKFRSFCKLMLKKDSHFACALPYQVPVSEGYYPLDQIQAELQEDGFDPIKFSIEMLSVFY